MKKLSLILATLSVAIAGSAFAQNSATGVTSSTDPAKAAAVERHADEIQKNPQPASSTMPAKHAVRHHVKKHQAKHHAKLNGKTHHAKKVAAK
ncbi:MAG: hypothetical protein JWQ21_2957 [Herminiimonas sp.]|nr:hypothetical protein [Herminiimonas sp.]